MSDSKITQAEMLQAAKKIVAAGIQPDRAVFWAFHLSINGRRAMAKIYKTNPALQGDRDSDEKHRAFILLLTKMRKMLFPAAKVSTMVSTVIPNDDANTNIDRDVGKLEVQDSFTESAVKADEEQFGKPLDRNSMLSYLAAMEAELEEGRDFKAIEIADDFVMNAARTLMVTLAVLKVRDLPTNEVCAYINIVQEMHDGTAWTRIWDDYRAGEVSLIEAGFLSANVYETKSKFFATSSRRLRIDDVDDMFMQAAKYHEVVMRTTTPDDGAIRNAFAVSDKLVETYACLSHCRFLRGLESALPASGLLMQPKTVIPKSWEVDKELGSSTPGWAPYGSRQHALMAVIASCLRESRSSGNLT